MSCVKTSDEQITRNTVKSGEVEMADASLTCHSVEFNSESPEMNGFQTR